MPDRDVSFTQAGNERSDMVMLAAFLLGLITGARTFLALALLSGYALFIAPMVVIAPFSWLGSVWAFTPLAALAALELWADKRPQTPSRTQTPGLIARLAAGALAGAALGGLWVMFVGVIGAAVGTYGCAQLRGWASKRLGTDLRAALTEDLLAATGALLVIACLV